MKKDLRKIPTLHADKPSVLSDALAMMKAGEIGLEVYPAHWYVTLGLASSSDDHYLAFQLSMEHCERLGP